MVFKTLLLVGLLLQIAPEREFNGHIREEGKKPYTNYSVQLREVKTNHIHASTQVKEDGSFSLPPKLFPVMLELVKDGKVICTEGPFNHTQLGVVVDCGGNAATWLLPAAALAGITSTINRPQVSGSR